MINRITILLNNRPTPERCEEIAHILSAEHFGADAIAWNVLTDLPEDTPLHLRDQFEAEVAGRNLVEALYFVVYGPESN